MMASIATPFFFAKGSVNLTSEIITQLEQVLKFVEMLLANELSDML